MVESVRSHFSGYGHSISYYIISIFSDLDTYIYILYTYICIYSDLFLATSECVDLSQAVSAAQIVTVEADSMLTVFKELKTTCDSSLLANVDKDKGIHLLLMYIYTCVCLHIYVYICVCVCKHEYTSA
jgi:hypothetical protein